MSIQEEQLLPLHTIAREMKNHLMETHGERDMQPHMAALFRDAGWYDLNIEGLLVQHSKLAEEIGQACGPDIAAVIPDIRTMAVPHCVATALHVIMSRGGHGVDAGDMLEAVVLHTDGRGRIFKPEGDAEPDEIVSKIQRGDLHDDFRMNPATKVREVMTTHYFEDDLVGGMDTTTIMQFYALSDGGRFAWDEPEFMSAEGATEQSGLIPDTVRSFFKGDMREVGGNAYIS